MKVNCNSTSKAWNSGNDVKVLEVCHRSSMSTRSLSSKCVYSDERRRREKKLAYAYSRNEITRRGRSQRILSPFGRIGSGQSFKGLIP